MASSSYDVVVIGGGLAGLAAAHALKSEGLQVGVLESENRAGGRVFTHHLPEGQHFELGAFSFGSHEQPLVNYIRQFALPIIEHSQMERPFWFRDQKGTMSEKGNFLKGKEREIPLSQLMNHFRQELGKLTEDMPLADALQKVGASPDAIAWLQANTLAGLLGDGFQEVSTEAALAYLQQYDSSTSFYALKGGNDQLPQAFAEFLKKEILFNCCVEKIEQLKDRCLVHGKTFTIEARKVIFAIPLTQMRKIEIIPPLSIEKQRAMENTHYTACARMSIVAPPVTPPRGGVFLFSDTLGWFRDQTAFQKDPLKQTVFNISVVGERARRFSKLPVEEWKRLINDALLQRYPNWDPKQAKYYTHSWQEGGYSYFQADRVGKQAILRAPEGRLHFAGEHTSDQFASMNGALKSGVRAATEIIKLR